MFDHFYESLLAILLGIVAWLLRNKDSAQAKDITLLWEKHDQDSKALEALRLEIAKEHYLKSELDSRFNQIETAIREMSSNLGAKFDHLTEVMIGHITQDK